MKIRVSIADGRNHYGREVVGLESKKSHQARHAGNFARSQDRLLFMVQLATSMQKAAKALLDTAELLLDDPKVMLEHAFQPTTPGLEPSTTAALEISWHAEAQVKKPFMSIIGKVPVAGKEVGIRAIWQEGVIRPVEDVHRS